MSKQSAKPSKSQPKPDPVEAPAEVQEAPADAAAPVDEASAADDAPTDADADAEVDEAAEIEAAPAEDTPVMEPQDAVIAEGKSATGKQVREIIEAGGHASAVVTGPQSILVRGTSADAVTDALAMIRDHGGEITTEDGQTARGPIVGESLSDDGCEARISLAFPIA